MIYEGEIKKFSGKIAIAVARFNQTITQRLLDGALYKLKKAKVKDNQIDVFWVPGAYELPTVADRLADTQQYKAIICLGAVIKGDTSHDLHINQSISRQFIDIARRYKIPVLFGVLTCDTVEQANARSVAVEELFGKKKTKAAAVPDKTVAAHLGNKGADCADSALQMISLMEQIEVLYDRVGSPFDDDMPF